MRIVNREQYSFPTDENFIHLATIRDDLSDTYIYFKDERTGQTYIEKAIGGIGPNGEIVGFLQQINDDQLWDHLVQFISKHGLNMMIDNTGNFK